MISLDYSWIGTLIITSFFLFLQLETLDELETIVSKLFGDVKNKQVKPVIYEHPFGPDELKRRFYVVPVKDIRSLKISFSAPDIVHQYRTAVSFPFHIPFVGFK